MEECPISVLLIEDDEDDYLLARDMLSEVAPRKYRLDWVASYTAGLEAFQRAAHDVVLLDYRLGPHNGLELLHEAAQHRNTAPVILLTGQGNYAVDLEAMQAGATDYLVKDQMNGQLLERAIRYAIQQKKSENQLYRANRALAALSQCNRILVRAADEIQLLQDICQAIVDAGGYSRVWVEMIGPSDGHETQVVARAGELAASLEELRLAWGEGQAGKSPAALAIATGKPQTSHAVTTGIGAPTSPAESVGDTSGASIALPLVAARQTYGVLNLYAHQNIAFDQEELDLLGELAGDLAFGIQTLRTRAHKERAEAELRRQAQRAQILADISHALAGITLNYQAVLETIVQKVAALIGDACVLTLASEDGQTLSPVAMSHQDPEALPLMRELLASIPVDVGVGPAGEVVRTGQAVLVAEISQEELRAALEEAHWPHPERFTFHSMLVTPLRAQSRVLGTLSLAREKPGNPYTPEDLQFVQEIAGRAALAIANAQLFEDSKHRLKQLQSLRHIDETIIGSVDLQFSMKVILEQVTALLEVDAVDLLLLEPYSQTLSFFAGRGFHTGALRDLRMRVGEGYAGQAALDRRMILIPDLRTRGTDLLRSPSFSAEGFITYLAVPLIAKGQVTGVLEVYHRQPFQPGQDWLNFLEALAGQTAIAIDNGNLFADLQRSNLQLTLAYDATIEGWSKALDRRDRETAGHTQRVTDLTLRLARAFNMSDAELVHLRRGALLHDIGKLGIPDKILHKPGPLDDEEWLIMRKHPSFAYEMLSSIAYLRPALDIPSYHHEKWDGSGYPHGLKGEQIPLAARIFAVVDVWDALNSDRPYRPAWPEEKTLEYIRSQSGHHFDPQVVAAFFEIFAGDA